MKNGIGMMDLTVFLRSSFNETKNYVFRGL